MHNKREYDRIGKPLPENIDPSRTPENLTLVDIPLRDAYQQIFGRAVDEYNARQTRVDRRIDDYMAKLSHSQNGEKLMYEDIVQWGAAEDFQRNPELREKAKEALVEYANTFPDRNPNLALVGAYIHMDEASPHLHIDYIPVSDGYKNGLAVRNSLDRAMKQMGFSPDGTESRKNNATMAWKERERAVFGEICRKHGLTIEAEQQGRGFSYSPADYGRMRDNLREKIMPEVRAELEAAEEQLEPYRELQTAVRKLDDVGRPARIGGGNKIVVRKDDLADLKEQAAAYTVNRDEIASLRRREADVSQREEEVEKREHKQENLNELYSRTEKDNAFLMAENIALSEKNKELEEEVNRFKKLAQRLWDRLRASVRAVAHILQPWGSNKYAGANEEQERLVDGVVALGERTAQELEQQGLENPGTARLLREPALEEELRKIVEPETIRRRGPRL